MVDISRLPLYLRLNTAALLGHCCDSQAGGVSRLPSPVSDRQSQAQSHTSANESVGGRDLSRLGAPPVTRKTTWVADPIHSSIPVSALEKQVISTQIFNRLHNILQNSTVYLTYPSNRTSRFSHSIGCLHIAGEICKYSFANAQAGHGRRFLDEVKADLLDRIEASEAFSADADRHFSADPDSKTLRALEPDALDDPVYANAAPPWIADAQQRYLFILAFQALRFSALLHDLGHPPFSHVAEFALGKLLGNLNQKPPDELTEREKRFLRITTQYTPKSIAFHEGLGRRLAEHVLNDVVESTPVNSKIRYDAVRLKHLTLSILDNASIPGRVLHEIVAGSLDADRLDYVPRDLAMSGHGSSIAEYGRLLASTQLLYVGNTPRVAFSVRALSSIEEFFRRRLNLYRYVVFHHRVAKTDGLLMEAIVSLATKYLASKESEEDSTRLLPHDISGLWSVLDPAAAVFRDRRVHQYIQWDDAWLLGTLRHHYFLMLSSGEDAALKIQLEEILSNKRHYYSLYKRLDSFVPVDEALIAAVPKDFSWRGVLRTTGANSELSERIETVEHYHRKFIDEGLAGLRRVREIHGLFVQHLLELLAIVAVLPRRELSSVAQPALTQLRDHFKFDDVIAIPKVLRAGVTAQFELIADDTVIPLNSVSRLADELRQATLLFPPFYVYVLRQSGVTEDELAAARKFLGTALWQSLESLLQSQEV